MLIGGIMCFVSTLSLGRNFGILPINRGVKTKAAYRFIRHPIYLSSIVLDAGIIMAFQSKKILKIDQGIKDYTIKAAI